MTNLNELALKLKNSVISSLNDKDKLDDGYLVKGDKTYTRRDLIEHITNETEFGMKILADNILLMIDISTRQKK